MSRHTAGAFSRNGLALVLAALCGGALAAGADLGQATQQATNWTAISMFAVRKAASIAMCSSWVMR